MLISTLLLLSAEKFGEKQQRTRHNLQATASEASRKELADGIEAFERNLQQLRGDKKAQLGNTLSYSLSRVRRRISSHLHRTKAKQIAAQH